MSKLRDLGHKLYTGEVSYDFVGRRRRWYVISAVLIAVSLLSIGIRGFQWGIEFEGGADFQAQTVVTDSTVSDMQEAVANSGVPDLDDATVTTVGDNQVRVQTRTLDPVDEVPQVRSAIANEAGVPSNEVAYSLIGASWGGQITDRALIALGVFLLLVTLVIWAYFRNWKMSVAALVALLHDLVLTIGIYALVGFTVTPATVIGVLTILGYSLYDTVVVFDKVRENVRDLTSSARQTYSEAANLAVNQVLVRSINTTIIGVLPVAALLFAGAFILGEGPLKDL
ncbi:MAG TPA: protein translocase subunit SecF, partial [Microlunatus sp.]|nr:protein translocase subunit SecF [Microlunatus sp.]